jgi:Kdo2-lipid IVA lauroyltransferase/acyltransferase
LTIHGTETEKPSPRVKRAKRYRGNTWLQRFLRSEGVERSVAFVVRHLIRFVRWIGRRRAEKVVLFLARAIGPLLPEHKIAANNIAMAFPEKSDAERAAILSGCWANFAAVAVEFLFLEEMTASFDPARPDEGPITVSGIDQFVQLRDDGKTAVIFTAHTANWEVLGVVATKFGLKTVLPYRAPTNAHFAEDILAEREALMGTLVPNSRGAAFEIAAAMEAGAHLGMLVDQKLFGGLRVPFFGHPARTNPLAARFARQFDCPVHGARAIRLPGGRLHLELTPPVDMPRDGEGLIDIEAATAKITNVVEGWVREHPEQWLWLHDRWTFPRPR